MLEELRAGRQPQLVAADSTEPGAQFLRRSLVLPLVPTVTSSIPLVEAGILEIERRPGAVRATLLFKNSRSEAITIEIDSGRVALVRAAGGTYRLSGDSTSGAQFLRSIPAGGLLQHRLEFNVPDTVLGEVRLELQDASADPDYPRFPPLTFTLPVP